MYRYNYYSNIYLNNIATHNYHELGTKILY